MWRCAFDVHGGTALAAIGRARGFARPGPCDRPAALRRDPCGCAACAGRPCRSRVGAGCGAEPSFGVHTTINTRFVFSSLSLFSYTNHIYRMHRTSSVSDSLFHTSVFSPPSLGLRRTWRWTGRGPDVAGVVGALICACIRCMRRGLLPAALALIACQRLACWPLCPVSRP